MNEDGCLIVALVLLLLLGLFGGCACNSKLVVRVEQKTAEPAEPAK